MKVTETVHQVHACMAGDVLLEVHQYAPGPASATPAHAHDGYQMCLSVDFPGEYRYRGATHAVPEGAITIIHPAEVHAARDPIDRSRVSTYRMIYVPSDYLTTVAASQSRGRAEPAPFFREPVILDASLARKFLWFHQRAADNAFSLEANERLLAFLIPLVDHYSGRSTETDFRQPGTQSIHIAREYLDAHVTEDVPLELLATIAQLSPFHFARSFRRQVGMPPHAYAIAARIDKAKVLLAQGMPPSLVAFESGFADQAHFTRHFKRNVGSTPAQYVGDHRKNVQDSSVDARHS